MKTQKCSTASTKTYVAYDGRAKFGETDLAIVLDVSENLKGCIQSCKDSGDGAVYSYDLSGEGELINEKLEWTHERL